MKFIASSLDKFTTKTISSINSDESTCPSTSQNFDPQILVAKNPEINASDSDDNYEINDTAIASNGDSTLEASSTEKPKLSADQGLWPTLLLSLFTHS